MTIPTDDNTHDGDAAAARRAIASFASPLTPAQADAAARIARLVSTADSPFVDVHELFGLYDELYFGRLLCARVEVSWSARLTLCAGICELVKDAQGQYRRIRLKLSEPLLKFRPRHDTVNTLLHEAIHAYFFVTTSWRHARGDDGDGHGPGFLLLADAINAHGHYAITVFHTFHDEVDSYRTHVWQCDGPCRHSPPFFGLVKRAMNRPPGKTDPWWLQHARDCGGVYQKIAEPDLTKDQLRALSAKQRAGRQKNKITSWVQPATAAAAAAAAAVASPSSSSSSPAPAVVVVVSRDDVATAPTKLNTSVSLSSSASPKKGSRSQKRAMAPDDDNSDGDQARNDDSALTSKKTLFACPICDTPVSEQDINDHLDAAHAFS